MFFNGWWRGEGGGCSRHAYDLCFAIINAKELSPPDTSLYTSYSAMQCNFWSGTVLAFQESLSSTRFCRPVTIQVYKFHVILIS